MFAYVQIPNSPGNPCNGVRRSAQLRNAIFPARRRPSAVAPETEVSCTHEGRAYQTCGLLAVRRDVVFSLPGPTIAYIGQVSERGDQVANHAKRSLAVANAGGQTVPGTQQSFV